jgi:toxin ParE1/3/4
MIVNWSKEALENLWKIEQYIGTDNPETAGTFVNFLIEQGARIAHNPNMGRMVPEISNPEIRELIVKKYRIVYRVHDQAIEILTVFEGHKLLRLDDADTES